MIQTIVRALILGALAVVAAALSTAQTLESLRGTILDPSGSAVPKAYVTVTGPNQQVRAVQTDASGAYAVPGLAPGKYTVRVSAAGFSLFEKTGVDVAARPVTVDASLAIATEAQEVTVVDTQHVEIDPSKNAGALVLKEADLDMLPDDPDDLQADLQALAGPAAGPNGGQMYIDGFSNGQLPPKESIREVRINSNPFSSEYDAPGYGRIEILTKPGSNKLRGMVQFNYGNSIWNARNPYSPEKPYYDTKNLNANLSGPIIKNKMSFFIDFARRDMRDSDLINAQLSPSLVFAESVIAPSERTNISPRIDYQLTPNITLQGRYSWVHQTQSNQGIGGINLASGTLLPPCDAESPLGCYVPQNTSTAYSQTSTNQTIQLTETQVVNPSAINETRFQYFRQRQNQTGDNPILNVQVNDEFAFGSSFPLQYTNQNNFELQNYTSINHGTQFFKFGTRLREGTDSSYYTTNFTGQYIFDSLAAYQTGAPTQYVIAGGTPLQDVKRFDAGLFVQDDWRVRPSLTVSLGARYEIQQNISDYGDFAPRIGIAWGLGAGQGRLRAPKTVLRAGYGWFYTRFPMGDTLQADRYNGVNQLQYIVENPCFFPAAPTIQTLANYSCPGAVATNSLNTYKVDSDLRAGLLMQTAVGIDRQLPKNTTLSINYINSRGIHQLQTVNINTPLPGTYSLANPSTAVYPYASTAGNGVLDLYESSGVFRQNQLIFNVNARLSSKFTLFGFYAYSRAYTDLIGQGGVFGGGGGSSAPSNPYDFAEDWGRSSFDIRHRLNINGNLVLPFGLRLSPNITANSAPPFNIVSGVDAYGDALFNARPAFEPAGFTGPSCTTQLANSGVPCVIATPKYGNLVINPTPGMTIIPPDYGLGFAQININMRLSRTWGWGENVTANPNRRAGGGGPPGGGRGAGLAGGGRGPGGGGFFGGGDTGGKRYTVTLGLYVRNILNTVNPGLPEGDLLSSRFGETLALVTAGQGATQSANRRMEINLRFGF